MFHKRSFLRQVKTMLDTKANQAVTGSTLTAVDKLAVRTALASLELLRLCGSNLSKPIETLTHDDVILWIQADRSSN